MRAALVALVSTLTAFTAAPRSAAPIGGPVFRYTGSDGCGNVFLYAWNERRTEVLIAQVDNEKLKLGAGTHGLKVTNAGDALTVHVDQFTERQENLPYCTDIISPTQKAVSNWRASAGKATLTIGERGAVPKAQPFMFKATLRLENLIMVGPGGRTVRAPTPLILTGMAGWSPG